MNVVAWVLDALKTHPEPVQLPDALADADPQALAEARSRLQQIGQVANELRKLIDAELAGSLQGSAFRYGNDILRPNNGRGPAKVIEGVGWWEEVLRGLQASPNPVGLLASMYPASAVRLTALPMLAAAVSRDVDSLRSEFLTYTQPTSPLSAMPIDKAPKYLQDLDEGEIRKLT